jgi:transcriptional regulator with XRE-family HTH domain
VRVEARLEYNFSRFHPKLPWEERLALIRQFLPSSPLMGPESAETEAAWRRAFERDVDLMGRILRDLLKADQAVPGRPGPRPALNPVKVGPQVDVLLGNDPLERPYTLQPFREAFTLLVGDRSLTQVARRTGLSRSHVHRFLRGEMVPTREAMEQIAVGFGKEASYFVEYRIAIIVSAIVNGLVSFPEKSVASYEALFWRESLVARA